MHHKKSINAKDLIQFQRKTLEQNENQNHTNQTAQPQNQQIQGQQTSRMQSRYDQKNGYNHKFLEKIRQSYSRNRYRSKKAHQQLTNSNVKYASCNLNSQQHQGQCDMQQKRRRKNYSPFLTNQSNADYQPRQQNNQNYKNFKPKYSYKKVLLGIRKNSNYTSIVPRKLDLIPDGSESKKVGYSPKCVQINPEINKTKLFSNKQKQKIQKEQRQYLKQNSYQLSRSRKNINLIRMKLNSLAQRADDHQVLQCQQIYKKIRQTEIKRSIELNLKKSNQIKLKFDHKKKFLHNPRSIQHRSMTIDLHSKQDRLFTEQKQTQHRVTNSQTIQIRQIPKYTIMMNSGGLEVEEGFEKGGANQGNAKRKQFRNRYFRNKGVSEKVVNRSRVEIDLQL